ncbi:hypothetical protein GC170_21870 [bacterium]|nr:hypothetical protein [bacterium]
MYIPGHGWWYAVTVIDYFSRYLLACHLTHSYSAAEVSLGRFLLKKQGRTWDGVPVPDVTVRSLSKTAIDTFRRLARASERINAADLKESATGLSEKLHLLDGKYLKRAAVLLLHADPEKFVTGAFVKIGFFRTNDDLLYHYEIHGDLFT